MELTLVIIGLFILVAIVRNKDLSENKENEGVFTWLSIFVIFLVVAGLGFSQLDASKTFPNYSLLIPMQICFAAIGVTSKGHTKVIATIAAISTLAFVIMGSYA